MTKMACSALPVSEARAPRPAHPAPRVRLSLSQPCFALARVLHPNLAPSAHGTARRAGRNQGFKRRPAG